MAGDSSEDQPGGGKTPSSGAFSAGRRDTNDVLPQVYEELRRLAEQHLAHERSGHTLQPTALAHEAYLRLFGSGGVSWDSRNHFLGAAARAIRRILVDHARARGRVKRGGGVAVQQLAGDDPAEPQRPLDLLALDEAMGRLAEIDPVKANLVEMRFFGGLTVREAAEVLGISEREARKEWQFARAWLGAQIGDGGASERAGGEL